MRVIKECDLSTTVNSQMLVSFIQYTVCMWFINNYKFSNDFPSFNPQFECILSTILSSQMIFPSFNTQFERGFSTILSFGNLQQNIIV
jgi:hypothetical protein